MKLLASLVDTKGKVLVPDFYEDVAPVTEQERKLYESIDYQINKYREAIGLPSLLANSGDELLMQRWRFPTLSIHHISCCGDGNPTIIPRTVKARISCRVVPNQSPQKIYQLVSEHISQIFRSFESSNLLTVNCPRQGDWWLADLNSKYFQAAEEAIKKTWNIEQVMKLKEGGKFFCHKI